MKQVALAVLAVALAACGQSQSPPPRSTPTVARAAPTSPPASPEARALLPRDVAGVELGTSIAAAQSKLGALDCHDNPQGFRVCVPKTPPADAPNKLEVYLVHDTVVSLSYHSDIGTNVWDFLNGLMKRYGHPSVNGIHEKDKQGRVHEIYGWKDDRTLFSVRFIWSGEGADRKLTSTAITSWDRKSYNEWEAERKQSPEKTPNPDLGQPT
jgi:hypothetical protein